MNGESIQKCFFSFRAYSHALCRHFGEYAQQFTPSREIKQSIFEITHTNFDYIVC